MNFLQGGVLASMLAQLRMSNKLGSILNDHRWRGLGQRSSFRVASQNPADKYPKHGSSRERTRRLRQMAHE